MTNNRTNLVELPDVSRRTFLQFVGGGLMIVVAADTLEAQERPPEIPSVPTSGQQERGGGGNRRGGRQQQQIPVAARVHIDKDGKITVMTGKVECGQGARAELTQAAAEELRVAPEQVHLVMADTSAVPDDGITAGSRTTPSTVPAVRAGASAARDVLAAIAAQKWNVKPDEVQARDGKIVAGDRAISYGELASDEQAGKDLANDVPRDVTLTNVKEWKVLGTSTRRPNARELVTGAHQFPSDVTLPGMLYGKVLRPPGLGAKLTSIDTAAAKSASPDATVIQDGNFIGVAAANARAATKALGALMQSAKWETAPRAPSSQLFDTLREKAKSKPQNPFADALAKATKQLNQTYNISYIQHVPMEPRAAVAQWEGEGKLTVWTASQNPFGVRSELARAFNLDAANVRVVVPDFGGGFGGKHSGECAIEAARLAKAAGKPVSLRWTRAEEFTWAYFRPAGVIDIAAGLDDSGTITSWHQLNINSGPQSVETPYKIAQAKGEFVQSEPPLRHGSYRALAATANVFAREVATDELALLAGKDPLEFRLAHLDNERLRAVVEAAAKKFGWSQQRENRKPNAGVGIACGIEKGSFLATCAAVEVNPSDGAIRVRNIAAAFECGKITNPDGLLRQARGAIVMGIGAALREKIEFDENGKIKNATFWKYEVPRFADVPAKLDVELLDRPDLASLGAGETPIIGIAPAIANAVFHATGTRLREMPLRLKA
jgi:isoquinoline 1-oxidoreductase